MTWSSEKEEWSEVSRSSPFNHHSLIVFLFVEFNCFSLSNKCFNYIVEISLLKFVKMYMGKREKLTLSRQSESQFLLFLKNFDSLDKSFWNEFYLIFDWFVVKRKVVMMSRSGEIFFQNFWPWEKIFWLIFWFFGKNWGCWGSSEWNLNILDGKNGFVKNLLGAYCNFWKVCKLQRNYLYKTNLF